MHHATYDRIGIGYDTTRKADPYLCDRLEALLSLPKEASVLDLGCGTGNYTTALQDRGLRMTGIDPSEKMLDEAKKRSGAIKWIKAFAEDLPFADASFLGAIATLTTHHWKDLNGGFQEVHRVLKPGGKVVILTSTPWQMRGYWLCHYFPAMMERSMNVMPSKEVAISALIAAGFNRLEEELYAVRRDLQDLFLYAAKEDPLRYLDPAYRRGISSFAMLADDAEVRAGLDRLNKDVQSGEWKKIRDRYANSLGDYLFIIAARN